MVVSNITIIHQVHHEEINRYVYHDIKYSYIILFFVINIPSFLPPLVSVSLLNYLHAFPIYGIFYFY
jgi:hypothetical protein